MGQIEESSTQAEWRQWLDYVILIVPVLVLLNPSLTIEFLSDNIGHIVDADTSLGDTAFQYYRPVTVATLIVDRTIWGLNSFGFHLTNLILHLLATVLVYNFVRAVVDSRPAAVLGGLLFGLHPIHAISIFWISGRVDIVCAIFYLLTLITYIHGERKGSTGLMVVSLLTYGVALFSKEMALSLPIVIALYVLVFHHAEFGTRLSRAVRRALPYVVVAIAFLLFRLFEVGSAAVVSNTHSNTGFGHLVENFVTFGGLLVIPGAHLEIASILDANPTFSLVALVVAVVILIVALRWILRDRTELFATLFILITLIPVSRLVMRWYLYIPSIGFCLLLGYLFARSWEKPGMRMPAAIATLILAVSYGGFLWTEQKRWITAGDIANEFSGRVAWSLMEHDLDHAYLLTVPSEYQETPVLMHGLENHLRHRLTHDLGDSSRPIVVPVAQVSLSDSADFRACHATFHGDTAVTLSLEGTRSSFIFPAQASFINKSTAPAVGTELIGPGFSTRIEHINGYTNVDRIRVTFAESSIPVLYHDGNSVRIVGKDDE